MKEFTILACGFKDNEQELIMNIFEGTSYILSFSDDFNDILCNKYFIVIIEEGFINQDNAMIVNNFFENIDGKLSEKVFIDSSTRTYSKLAHFNYYNTLGDFMLSMASIIPKAQKRVAKEAATARSVNNILKIYNYLEMHSTASIDELSKLVNKDNVYIQRYIELLQFTYENLVYDYDLEQWSLLSNKR